MFLAAAHSYLLLCLLLCTECLVSASEQVVNLDEWRGIMLYNTNNNYERQCHVCLPHPGTDAQYELNVPPKTVI